MRFRYLLVAPLLALSGVAGAPPAAADCTTSGNTTICSLGSGEDSSAPERGPSRLPFVPYPCAYDYYCNSGYNWFTP